MHTNAHTHCWCLFWKGKWMSVTRVSTGCPFSHISNLCLTAVCIKWIVGLAACLFLYFSSLTLQNPFRSVENTFWFALREDVLGSLFYRFRNTQQKWHWYQNLYFFFVVVNVVVILLGLDVAVQYINLCILIYYLLNLYVILRFRCRVKRKQ